MSDTSTTTSVLYARVPSALHAGLTEAAWRRRLSATALLRQLLEDFLKGEAEQPTT
jgi:hypothetical protein